MSGGPAIRAVRVYGEYLISQAEAVKAVRDVSIDVGKDEVVGIAGESGCGKSTLIKILYGYIEPPLIAKGRVLLDTGAGEPIDVLALTEDQRRKNIWWKEMSYIPQNSMNVLNPYMRIWEHFAEILKKHLKLDKEEAYRVAREHIKSLGMREEVLKAYPSQLSGGMRQRVVISLALLLKPRVIFADEPTTAVDVVLQKALLQLLLDKQKEYRNSLVIVTHDMGVHAMATQKIVIMYAGRVVEVSPTEEFFEDPKHPYSKALVESLPRLGDEKARIGLPGSPPNLRNPPPGCEFHPRCPLAMDICRKEAPPLIEYGQGRAVRCWLYAK